VAEIIGGIGTSHVPAVGAALDKGRTAEPYWAPFFEKTKPLQEWTAAAKPDVAIIVFNDHATAFSLEIIPTFALGMADRYEVADEGFGARPVPPVIGHPELSIHLAEQLILDEFDLTLVNEMTVDHGLTVPLSVTCGQPGIEQGWPLKVVPLCVNVVQYPPPTGNRCFRLGQAIRRAVESFPGDERVVVYGTGGLSHQISGQRAGLINTDFDARFLDLLVNDPETAAKIPHIDYVREAGAEGIEMVMWLVMRGALPPVVREIYRADHVPTSNTHFGMLVVEPVAEPHH
jgi:protocatechuate 4,5-dioxygenase, beta chain